MEKRFLDDIELSTLSNADRERLLSLYRSDRLAFYRLWRDPAQAQKLCQEWELSTGGKPDEMSVEQINAVMAYLKLSGAPSSVGRFYRMLIDNKFNGPRDLDFDDKPIKSRIEQIAELERRLVLFLLAEEEQRRKEGEELDKQLGEPNNGPYDPGSDRYSGLKDVFPEIFPDDKPDDSPSFEISRDHMPLTDEEELIFKFKYEMMFTPDEVETLVKVIGEYGPKYYGFTYEKNAFVFKLTFGNAWIPEQF